MRRKIDCFVPFVGTEITHNMVATLCAETVVNRVNIMLAADKMPVDAPENCNFLTVGNLTSSATMQAIAAAAEADYVLLCLKPLYLEFGLHALERMVRVAEDSISAMVYADFRTQKADGSMQNNPLIDYQKGSLRDDFDFGQCVVLRTSLLKEWASQAQNAEWLFAGFYDLRLFLSRKGRIMHLNEMLYVVNLEERGERKEEREYIKEEREEGSEEGENHRLRQETFNVQRSTFNEKNLKSDETSNLKPQTSNQTEAQFDYVNPRNREVQIEMERVCTLHLEALGALIDTSKYYDVDFNEQDFDVEASVIIPVFNRERTVADAVRSALEQKTSFKFNVIVVDNHSTDGTTAILQELAKDEKLVHLIPERTDLGIGGCWNLAIDDARCGRFAVQLDSDDIYSSCNTLQRVVDAFRREKAAMIVGSYRLCDMQLQTLPPGLIDHREWTDENGANNALRINGLGAPRAFFTPVARQIHFPNTSYGEDYAMGLAMSRHYKIGRIYDELYLCRRWGGNSDSSLTIEKQNANNLYKDRLRTLELEARQHLKDEGPKMAARAELNRFTDRQLSVWDDARLHYRSLQNVVVKELSQGDITLKVQMNPARMVSTGAKIDKKTIAERPCFLCEKNRPKVQMQKKIDDDLVMLLNPFPILPMHFTIASRVHRQQNFIDCYAKIRKILNRFPELIVFYNGPKCGASAPDHLHLQAGTSGVLPLQSAWQRMSRNLDIVVSLNNDEYIAVLNDYVCPAFVVRSRSANADFSLFRRLYRALPLREGDTEPMMNVVSWRSSDEIISVVFPRRKHRPDCYYAEGGAQKLVSPGALDMSGLIITPRKADFESLSAEDITGILCEVSATPAEMNDIIDRLKSSDQVSEKALSAKKMIKQPTVSVGIVSGEKICFALNKPYIAKGEEIIGEQTATFSEGGIMWRGAQYSELLFVPQSSDASFSMSDVTIGANFHWERKETQVFQGALRLVVEADKICAINELPVENYLMSVISSEMAATSSLELLKAHAVISRSWLLAQMQRRANQQNGGNSFFSFIKKDDELIRWYDREDHTIFDVCADDHCQRYQGITKATSKNVAEAVRETRGQILMSGDDICDARFSKCCGGATEEFQYCWEDSPKSYLVSVRDDVQNVLPDLTNEEEAQRWIRTSPQSFCNTTDKNVLSQVLNDYDQETADFYRWRVSYTQDELKALIESKLKMKFGAIVDLIPLERGKSGRISRLKIVGTERQFTIGKELEIRRALSETHLLSSAFVVDKSHFELGIAQQFDIIGAGWGHGVGLCQIGAAMMGAKGYRYDQILLHYYRDAEIRKIYK